jgi:hypothetical protein
MDASQMCANASKKTKQENPQTNPPAQETEIGIRAKAFKKPIVKTSIDANITETL